MALEIWAEKYRPKNLSEVINQRHVVERMKAFVKAGSVPHLMFAGPAGTGKTTMGLAVAREIYGKDWRKNVLELNASVTPDTPILVRMGGVVKRTDFAEMEKRYFSDSRSKYSYPEDLEILSVDRESMKVEFKPVSNISRHRVDKIAEIEFEGGGVKTTLDHSLIVLGEDGSMSNVRTQELKPGDTLLSFSANIPGSQKPIDLEELAPQENWVPIHGMPIKNPKVRNVTRKLKFNEELCWLMGSYMAEGAVPVKHRMPVFTYGYPDETRVAEEACFISNRNFGVDPGLHTTVPPTSGRESAIQTTLSSVQLARLFHKYFYSGDGPRNAWAKRVPEFVFSLPTNLRHKFLMGYMGDAAGEWNDYVRYSSRSRGCLIDVSWLGRLSGLNTSIFDTESRIVWKRPTFSCISSELLPSAPIIGVLSKLDGKIKCNWRYKLRHQLYSKGSSRVPKRAVKDVLEKIDFSSLSEQEKKLVENLDKLSRSDIFATKIKSIKIKDYDGFVFDVSVPDSEMFWGGTAPVLLHNSDERGIDIIRHKVKEFARTRPIGGMPFRIVILDEADALTQEAQQALRRTMESFTEISRFVLICNWSSKIIEPIQSRCAVFRFRALGEDDIKSYIKKISDNEKLKIDDKAIGAIIEITEGDLRRVSNLMQSAASLSSEISEDVIYDAASRAKPNDVREMMRHALGGNFGEARGMLQNLLLKQGLAGNDVLSEIHRQIYNFDISEDFKMKLIDKCAEYEFRVSEGGNELLQISALLAQMAAFSKK